MATFSSSTTSIVVLLLSAIVVVAGGTAGLEDAVKAACAGTPDPATCFLVLSPSANASNTANECVLALLAAERAADLLEQAHEKVLTALDDEKRLPSDSPCLIGCVYKIGDASMELYGRDMFRSADDQKVTISLVRRFVQDAKAKHLVWSCHGCRAVDKKKVEEVAKGSKMDKFMEVLYVLVDRVPAGLNC